MTETLKKNLPGSLDGLPPRRQVASPRKSSVRGRSAKSRGSRASSADRRKAEAEDELENMKTLERIRKDLAANPVLQNDLRNKVGMVTRTQGLHGNRPTSRIGSKNSVASRGSSAVGSRRQSGAGANASRAGSAPMKRRLGLRGAVET
jgi:hypothetical protein